VTMLFGVNSDFLDSLVWEVKNFFLIQSILDFVPKRYSFAVPSEVSAKPIVDRLPKLFDVVNHPKLALNLRLSNHRQISFFSMSG
ncbi:hypothetical protein EZS27_027117, partial [termite gut metagenome]